MSVASPQRPADTWRLPRRTCKLSSRPDIRAPVSGARAWQTMSRDEAAEHPPESCSPSTSCCSNSFVRLCSTSICCMKSETMTMAHQHVNMALCNRTSMGPLRHLLIYIQPAHQTPITQFICSMLYSMVQLIQLQRHCPMPPANVYMVPSMYHQCRALQPRQTCTACLARRRCSSTVDAQPVQNVHRPSRSRHQAQTRHSMQQPTILKIQHHAHLTQPRQGIQKTCSMTSAILLPTAQRERSARAQRICQKS
jgi:hypothetical protein